MKPFTTLISNTMKNKRYSLLAFTMALLSFSLSSCIRATDNCDTISCVNGECVEGECACDAGYEGPSCSHAFNAKFRGTYHYSAICVDTTGTVPDSVTILTLPGSAPNSLTITGLWRSASSAVAAEIDNAGTSFTIARQPIATGFDISCGPSGIDTVHHKISMAFKIYPTGANTAMDSCSVVLAR